MLNRAHVVTIVLNLNQTLVLKDGTYIFALLINFRTKKLFKTSKKCRNGYFNYAQYEPTYYWIIKWMSVAYISYIIDQYINVPRQGDICCETILFRQNSIYFYNVYSHMTSINTYVHHVFILYSVISKTRDIKEINQLVLSII